MLLEITATQDFGTPKKPKLGVLLTSEDGDIFRPSNRAIVRDADGHRFYVVNKPEHGVWVVLTAADATQEPCGRVLRLEVS